MCSECRGTTTNNIYNYLMISRTVVYVLCDSLTIASYTHVRISQLEPPPLLQVGSVLVYDPVLSEDELMVVESFECLRIPVNESCRRAVSHPTLFFMLHCDMAMYNNLLGANWGREGLLRVAILGNPLSFYHLR